jgi:hypothetical protein
MSTIIDGSAGITFPNSTVQASAGQILQVVTSSYSSNVSNSTTTYADSNLTATITPKFATSKILVCITGEGYKTAGNLNNVIILNICRNGSQIVEFANGIFYTGTAIDFLGMFGVNYLDSPATTSATTYKMQFKNGSATPTVYVQANNMPSTITLLEIAQ